eukprot:ctg_780.g182
MRTPPPLPTIPSALCRPRPPPRAVRLAGARRPDHPAHYRRHGAVQADIPGRARGAPAAACRLRPEMCAHDGRGERRPHPAPSHLLRNAGQLLLRRLLQAAGHGVGVGAAHPGVRPAGGAAGGVVGVPAHRIARMGESDNFWASGPTGPCGPCSEIYYELVPATGAGGNAVSAEAVDLGDDARFIELYNLVFMEFNRDATGQLTPLAAKNIDTGMGLERLAQVLQGVPNNYETDLIRPIVDEAASLAGCVYDSAAEDARTSLKVIGDHTRAVVHLLADGVRPSNMGRGYVLRRLIRRLVRHGRLVGVDGPFVAEVAEVAIRLAAASGYQQVQRRREEIVRELAAEESRFLSTLLRGEALLEEILQSGMPVVSGTDAFTLYDTYGFPVEMTQEIAGERGLQVDMQAFDQCMAEQRERARGQSAFHGAGDGAASHRHAVRTVAAAVNDSTGAGRHSILCRGRRTSGRHRRTGADGRYGGVAPGTRCAERGQHLGAHGGVAVAVLIPHGNRRRGHGGCACGRPAAPTHPRTPHRHAPVAVGVAASVRGGPRGAGRLTGRGRPAAFRFYGAAGAHRRGAGASGAAGERVDPRVTPAAGADHAARRGDAPRRHCHVRRKVRRHGAGGGGAASFHGAMRRHARGEHRADRPVQGRQRGRHIRRRAAHRGDVRAGGTDLPERARPSGARADAHAATDPGGGGTAERGVAGGGQQATAQAGDVYAGRTGGGLCGRAGAHRGDQRCLADRCGARGAAARCAQRGVAGRWPSHRRQSDAGGAAGTASSARPPTARRQTGASGRQNMWWWRRRQTASSASRRQGRASIGGGAGVVSPAGRFGLRGGSTGGRARAHREHLLSGAGVSQDAYGVGASRQRQAGVVGHPALRDVSTVAGGGRVGAHVRLRYRGRARGGVGGHRGPVAGEWRAAAGGRLSTRAERRAVGAAATVWTCARLAAMGQGDLFGVLCVCASQRDARSTRRRGGGGSVCAAGHRDAARSLPSGVPSRRPCNR